jgi:hypothetical protein
MNTLAINPFNSNWGSYRVGSYIGTKPPSSPQVGDTFYDTNNQHMMTFDGSQWVVMASHAQGLWGPSGIQSVFGSMGPTGPTGTPGPVGIKTPQKPRGEWKPFFAIWPRRTINGKLRAGRIFRRTQVYEEWTDFSVVERMTFTTYATKKEVFVWKMKYQG